ncbi:hypothetical protein FRC11_000714, partial [Ceratobasidium sp. 423]
KLSDIDIDLKTQLSQHLPSNHPPTADRRQDIPIDDADQRRALQELEILVPTGDPIETLRATQLCVEELARGAKGISAKVKQRAEEYTNSLISVGFVRFAGLENAGRPSTSPGI